MQRVRLHQQTFQFHAVQELPQSRDLAAGVGGVGALGDGHAQRVGVETHLSNKTHCAGSVFSDRASQCLAVAHQSVDRVCDTGLGRHPLLEQGLESLHVELSQQQAEGGIRRRLDNVSAEQLVESLAMPLGETLHAQQRTLAAQDGQDRHQQHPPLREAHPAAHAAVRQRLEEADQVRGRSRALGLSLGQGSGAELPHENPGTDRDEDLGGQTFNRPWGFPRKGTGRGANKTTGWEDIADMTSGTVSRTIVDDTLPGGPVERTITYEAPFDRCDRVEDYRVAWEFFDGV